MLINAVHDEKRREKRTMIFPQTVCCYQKNNVRAQKEMVAILENVK